MKRQRATWEAETVRLTCGWCLAHLTNLTAEEIKHLGQANLTCKECKGINYLGIDLITHVSHRKARVDPDNPPGRAIAWDGIVGNLMLKRAMEIAIVGHHTLTYVGDPSIAWKEVQAILGARATIMQICPCGNYNNPEAICVCDPEKLQAWRQSKKFEEAMLSDIIVDAVTPKPEEFFAWREPYNNVLDRVRKVRFSQSFGRSSFVNHELGPGMNHGRQRVAREVLNLLSQAQKRVSLTTLQLQMVGRVALTIADMEGKEIVSIVHVAEALGYRTALLLYNY